jgi:hypothetical protein
MRQEKGAGRWHIPPAVFSSKDEGSQEEQVPQKVKAQHDYTNGRMKVRVQILQRACAACACRKRCLQTDSRSTVRAPDTFEATRRSSAW